MEPEPPPEELAPLVRVLATGDPEPAEPEAEDDLEPLLRVLTTGAAEATERVPLERVRVAEDAGALEPRDDLPEDEEPGPLPPA